MKLLLFMLAALAYAQNTLPAVNTVAGASVTCSFESNDSSGGLVVTCKRLSDGSVMEQTVISTPSEEAEVPGYGEIKCLYWLESPGKFRLQCATGEKIVLDGYMPPVTRRKRWYLIWR